MAAPLRREPGVSALVLCACAAYATLSLLRHAHFQTGGYDLGIFDQAVWHYARI